MRKTYEELNELCKKYKVDRLYSWSRFNKYKTSPFEYYLSYIKHEKEDKEPAPYGLIGNSIHDSLEKYYKDEIKFEDIENEFSDYWCTIIDISQLKFNKSSDGKNDLIQDKYYDDLIHFCKNHNPIKYKVITEQFIIIKVGKYVFQGYMDACYKDEDNNYTILDFKTSTIYKGDKALKEAGQLILYAEGLRQLGIPLEKIKICWNFLKYVSVSTQLANGKENIREIERCKIGESLSSNCKMWLKKLGYEDEIDTYIEELKETNSIECLPKDIQDKYKFDDCYVYVDLTEELINNLKENIENTIDEIVSKELEYKETKNEKLFWDSSESLEKQSYYFANLCGYSGRLHLPYGEYLKNRDKELKNKDNVFSGLGSGNSDDEDLDWLNNL